MQLSKLRFIADQFILFPSREPVAFGEATRTQVPDTDLEIWIHRRPCRDKTPKPKLYLLHFIGNASRAEWEHPIFLDLLADDYDVEAWVLNYPGYGKSGGKAQLEAIPPATLKAYDALRSISQDHPFLISGNSLGTSAALYLATQRAADGIILQNPPPIQDMIINRYGWWNLWLVAVPVAALVPRELNSLLNARKAKIPALFLTSEHDFTVPPKFQKKVVEAYAGPCRQLIIPGAGHNTDLPEKLFPEVRAAVQSFMEGRDEVFGSGTKSATRQVRGVRL